MGAGICVGCELGKKEERWATLYDYGDTQKSLARPLNSSSSLLIYTTAYRNKFKEIL